MSSEKRANTLRVECKKKDEESELRMKMILKEI